MKDLIALRYPIGNFEYGKKYTINETRKHIKEIAALPKNLKKAVKKLKDGALDKPYRPNGWTARQVIHHLADSHMNAYIRMKLTVTENTPVVKPYEEQLWAEMEDGKYGSAKLSIKLLTALHERWVQFLSTLTEEDLERGYFHPVSKMTIQLQEAIALYAWHSKHHLAHIKIVASGKATKAIKEAKAKAPKKKEKEETKVEPKADSVVKAEPKAGPAAPKKRAMSEAHKEKIRAAHAARSAAKAAKPAAAKAAKAAKTPTDTATPKKRGRPSKATVAAADPAMSKPVKAAKAAKPAKVAKPVKEKPVKVAKAAKPAKVTKAKAAPAGTRVRRTKEQIAADNAAKAAAPKLSRAEILEKARAARKTTGDATAAKPAKVKPAKVAKPVKEKPVKVAKAAKPAKVTKAKAAPAAGTQVRRTKEEIAADKAAKAAAPKLSRAEILEKARAARKSTGVGATDTAGKKTKK